MVALTVHASLIAIFRDVLSYIIMHEHLFTALLICSGVGKFLH